MPKFKRQLVKKFFLLQEDIDYVEVQHAKGQAHRVTIFTDLADLVEHVRDVMGEDEEVRVFEFTRDPVVGSIELSFHYIRENCE